MKRRILSGAIGFAVGYFLEEQLATLKCDLDRYNRLRAMSDEPPFLREQLKRLWGRGASTFATCAGRPLLDFVQRDLVRYAKMKSM